MSVDATVEPLTETPAPPPSMDDLWTRNSADTSTPDSEPDTVETAPVEPESEPDEATTAPEPASTLQPTDTRKGKPRHDAKARMLDATRKEAEAKRALAAEREQRAQLEARLAALERERTAPPASPQAPQAAPSGDKFPRFDAWADSNPGLDFDDYLEARDAWRDTRVTSQWEAKQAQIAREAQFNARVEAIRRDESIAQAIQQYNPTLSPVMAESMKDSARVADIVRYLVTHPDACTQLAHETMDVSSPEAVRLMRLHLESLASAAAPMPESAPSARPSSALPPVSRVGGTANATPTAIDDLEFGPEYIRKANEAERKQREARRW